MPGLTGLETARRLKLMGDGAPVVFLTSSAEYALEAFQVRANHYLLKPVRTRELFNALDELLPAEEEDLAELPGEGSGNVMLSLDSILYLECADHRLLYHLEDGTIVRSRTLRTPFLQSVQPLLRTGFFLQPHRSYLVHAGHILRLTGRSVILDNGAELAISQMKVQSFRQQYMDFLAGGKL